MLRRIKGFKPVRLPARHLPNRLGVTIYLVVFALATGTYGETNAAVPADFVEATTLYQQAMSEPQRDVRLQKFRQAARQFRQLAEGDGKLPPVKQSAELLVNWGNAALQSEQLGEAILAFRRALLVDPNHKKARQNLFAARSQLPEWVPRAEADGIWQSLFFWRTEVSLAEQGSIAAMCFLIGAALIAAGIYWQQRLVRSLSILPLVAWAILIISLISQSIGSDGQDAVVVVDEVTARAADSHRAPPKLAQALPSGTELTITETRSDWSHANLPDGRDIWVPSTSVSLIAGQ